MVVAKNEITHQYYMYVYTIQIAQTLHGSWLSIAICIISVFGQ
jgi:hypothetical protein